MNWVFAGFELTLLALAVLHAGLAIKTSHHKARVKPQRHAAAQRPAITSGTSGEPAIGDATR